MTEQKDALFVQTVFAFSQGCGGTGISEEAATWFHGRYYDWIDKPKENEQAKGQCPQDVWDKHGTAFLDHFKHIGERAAGVSTGEIDSKMLETEATAHEKSLDCPWCPDRA
jgi:hypothetical protein